MAADIMAIQESWDPLIDRAVEEWGRRLLLPASAQPSPRLIEGSAAPSIPKRGQDERTGGPTCRRGLAFHWVEPRALARMARTPDAAALEENGPEPFFGAEVGLDPSPFSLYEDIDAAFIAGVFGKSDQRYFATLGAFQTAINGNALRLALLLSALMAVAAVWSGLSAGVVRLVPGVVAGVDISVAAALPGAAAVVTALAAIAMLLVYFMPYRQAQRNNGQQLSTFLTGYFGRLNSEFNAIEGNSTRAMIVDTGGGINGDTPAWLAALNWTALRAFFMKLYLRNIVFRIRRNTVGYLVLAPALTIAAVLALALIARRTGVATIDPGAATPGLGVVAFAGLALIFAGCLRWAPSFFDESIRDRRWREFEQLDFQQALQRVLLTYLVQLHNWRTINKPDR